MATARLQRKQPSRAMSLRGGVSRSVVARDGGSAIMTAIGRWSFVCLMVGCASTATVGPQAMKAPPDEALIDMRLGVARMAERNGAWLEAEKAYREVLDRQPQHRWALHRMGVVHVHLDQMSEAHEYFEQALETGDADSELLCDVGYARLLANDPGSAEASFRRAAEMDPGNERVTRNLAMAVGYQGRLDESLDLFRRVNTEAEALANVGFLLSQLGELPAAGRYFHRALDLNPRLKPAAQALVEIQARTSHSQASTDAEGVTLPELPPQRPSAEAETDLAE